jgi:hypothetical protein
MMRTFMYLSEVAEVLPGHPFRGKIEPALKGNALVVQMKDVDSDTGIDWPSLMRVYAGGRKVPTWLQHNDIIFAARGTNNYAIHVDSPIANVVLSPHFFLIRVKSGIELLPEFLAWQINQAPARKYFASSSEGSLTVSIRRAVLESLPVTTPSLEEQKKVVQLVRCWKQQQKAIRALENNNDKLMAAIANNVFNKTIG